MVFMNEELEIEISYVPSSDLIAGPSQDVKFSNTELDIVSLAPASPISIPLERIPVM
jgi:hypothetical protein